MITAERPFGVDAASLAGLAPVLVATLDITHGQPRWRVVVRETLRPLGEC